MSPLPSSDFDKISPTALLTAYARQFSDIPYTKEIAELTNAIATVNQFAVQGQTNPLVLGLAALVEGRYKGIEQVRSQFHATQILELASGLLPRGMILSQHPEMTFIESDLPQMIEQKQRLVHQLVGERSNLHFLTIDATNNLNSSLLSNYFQSNQPVNILCEGLLMYLTFAEKQQVFANVRQVLEIFGGVWITPDLTTKVRSEQMGRTSTSFAAFSQQLTSITGRILRDNEFTDLDHAKQFAQEQGFQIEAFSTLDVLDQLKSLAALGIEQDIAKLLLTNTPVFVLSLASG